jgi:hypothetical protein
MRFDAVQDWLSFLIAPKAQLKFFLKARVIGLKESERLFVYAFTNSHK